MNDQEFDEVAGAGYVEFMKRTSKMHRELYLAQVARSRKFFYLAVMGWTLFAISMAAHILKVIP